ncbi:MAG: PIG-L deacetylase family protein [Acidimicrobiales bacterium]
MIPLESGSPQPSVNLDPPARALAIGAHPDDVEFGCGGTLAKWAAAGTEIHHLVCTDGSKGSWDPEADPAALVMARQHEQRAAAAALGSTGEVVFLGWRDGELDSGLRQRFDVCHWIRRLRPQVILGHDPWKRYRIHPDHRHAGLLAVESVVAARDPHFFPEQAETPWRPQVLLLWEADEIHHAEDIGASIATKIVALLEHASQYESTMAISRQMEGSQRSGSGPSAEHQAFAAKISRAAAVAGEPFGLDAAEGFARIDKL